MIRYIDLPNTTEAAVVSPDSLELSKSKELVTCLVDHSFCELLECKILSEGDELVIFNIQPQVSQAPVYDIRYTERIAILIEKNDSGIPYVFALRDDFPHVSHLNAMPFEKPRSLCLYEIPYDDLKIDWRAISFIERIREWLELTADGSLHQSDQPLEPFLNNLAGRLILPEKIDNGDSLNIVLTNTYNNKNTLVATKEDVQKANPNVVKFKIFCHVTPEFEHGVIRTSPTTLLGLQNLLKDLEINFIEDVLKPQFNGLLAKREFHDLSPIFLIIVPKKRDGESTDLTYERIAFVSYKSIKEISLAISLWGEAEEMLAPIFPQQAFEDEKIQNFAIGALATYTHFSKSAAAQYNDIDLEESKVKIVLIGGGALGSQLFANLTRMGFGSWFILDDDVLLPHNLARHALNGGAIGYSKSVALSITANEILNNPEHSNYLQDNYLHPIDHKSIDDKLSEAEIILDVSASLPVARKLAYDKFHSRRVSIFLNPSGSSLVILAESYERNVLLDCIEMQYYRFLLRERKLEDHLISDGTIRYGNSCRDISGRMRQHNIAMLAGIGSKAIVDLKKQNTSAITIWESTDIGGVEVFSSEVFEVEKVKTESWNVVIDHQILSEIFEKRRSMLPKETGGILLGSYDMSRKIIYIVETILSPSDSKEYPNAYYRGIDGVPERVARIHEITAGNVSYIGEWHSHPDGASLNRSADDDHLFEWIKNHMQPIGRPPLMLIAGGQGNFKVYTD